jgi:uncharacterized protein (TIGR04222 family)
MTSLHHMFPFDMPPGPGFMVVYLVIAGGVFAATLLLRNAIGRGLDAAAAAATMRATPIHTGGYRAPAAEQTPVLGMGRLPRGIERWAVAYLRGGFGTTADALAAGVVARNLVVVGADKTIAVSPAVAVDDALLAELHTELLAGADASGNVTVAQLRAAARSVAVRHSYEFTTILDNSGLNRPAGTRTTMRLVALAGTVLVLAIGVLRLVVRADLYGGAAPFPAYLSIELVVFGIVGLLMMRIPTRSSAADAYLSWLDDATTSLRNDVSSGLRRETQDV